MNKWIKGNYWKPAIWLLSLVIIGVLLQFQNLTQTVIIYDKLHAPYYLDSTLTIASSEKLIIKEGTTLIIDTGVDIIVHGSMIIKGTEKEPVKLLPKVDTIGWGRIRLLKPGSHCKFGYAEIIDGTVESTDVNLTYRNVHFTNRQNLPKHFNITKVVRATADLQDCSIMGSGTGEGFLLMNMDGATIRNCSFNNIPDAIEITRLRNSSISNNLITHVKDDAIDLNNCENVSVDSNIIIHAHDRGVEIGSEIFGSSKNISIRHNLIVNCKEGITFKEGSNGSVINNTLYKNKYGIVCQEIVEGKGGSKVIIENTIISQSRSKIIETDSLSEVVINYSLSDNGIMNGKGNLSARPRFVDPKNNDFYLRKKSPCINAGNPESEVDPDGTRRDIGAYYFDINSD